MKVRLAAHDLHGRDGRQFVVAVGGKSLQGSPVGSKLVAFALPR